MSRYVWIDWSSMPQPSACPPSVDQKVKKELGTNLGKAVKSIPAYVFTSLLHSFLLNSHASTFVNRYVEKSDFVVIVAPGCLHADRRDPDTNLRTKTCYRTYRNRGWCVLEMMCSYLHSREKTHPALLITSAEGTPEWVSPLEALKLAVGLCDFTCCQRNHKFGDKIVPCDRGITREILETLIASKVKHLFKTEQHQTRKTFSLHDAVVDSWTFFLESKESCDSLTDLKHQLRWDESIDGQDSTMPWIDRAGISILAYAVALNEIKVVKRDSSTLR